MKVSDIFSLLNVSFDGDLPFIGVSINSRTIQKGELFLALKGEHFDGHDYIKSAIEAGAAGVVTERFIPNLSVPQAVVPDTLQALTTIAAFYRSHHFCPAIALTGSNGKTSVKEMIASILPKPSYATKGNLNNQIGVPLSVLALSPEHRYAVFELGASRPLDIAYTVSTVQPQVTLINNIAPAHIAGFGSIDGVAKAKGEIYQGAATDTVAVVNEDDEYAHFWDESLSDKKVLRFSSKKPADIWAKEIQFDKKGCGAFLLVTPQGECPVNLQVPGVHMIQNALAAAACTHGLGLPLKDIALGLNHFTGVKGRLTFISGKNECVIIDDTYNANLRSVLAALAVLAQRPGRRIFVFGDMGELGEWSAAHHDEVGRAAAKYGIETVMTYGAHSLATTKAFGEGAKHYESQEALVNDLVSMLDHDTVVLVKGSRSSKMENIVHQLIAVPV